MSVLLVHSGWVATGHQTIILFCVFLLLVLRTAFAPTGWGLYHYFMIGMASACSFSQATGLTSIPFATPLALCDMTYSANTLTIIDACFLLGTAVGGFFLSSLSDITGRKFMIPFTLMLIFTGTFACGFAHGPGMIMTCAFVLGSGIATNANCVKIHLAEILPVGRRGTWLVFPDLFWSFGYISSSLVAWLLTPSILHNQKFDIRMATWRLMFGLSGMSSIMVSCATALLQPSPRYLMFRRRYSQALDTLKRIYAVNSSRHCDTYTIRQEDLFGCVDEFSLNEDYEPTNCTHQMISTFQKCKNSIRLLVNKRFVYITIVLIFMKIGAIFGILSTNIWLSKMLEDSGNSNCSFTGLSILHLDEGIVACNNFNLPVSLYRNFFLIALSIIFGQIVLIFLIDRIGRKVCIIGGCVTCGTCSFLLGYINNAYLMQFLTSSILMATYSLVESALSVVIIEVYPTAFRGTAAGGTQFLANFIGIFVKSFLQTPCHYSFIFVGAFLLAAGVLGSFIPELHDQAMVE